MHIDAFSPINAPIFFCMRIVYDVCSSESFEGLDVWLNELDTYATKKTLIKMLVANKIDKVCEKDLIFCSLLR